MRSFNIFLLVYCIGNSNYLIITCVPKLGCSCCQAIRLRHINEGFYSILYTVIDICMDLLKRGYRTFKCILNNLTFKWNAKQLKVTS